MPSGSCAARVLDPCANHCNYTLDMPHAWIQIDLSLRCRLRCDAYCLRSDAHSSQKLRCWEFQGSMCGTQWETIRSHANDSALECARFSEAAWHVDSHSAYRRYRIVQTGRNSSNKQSIMLHGWDLYGTLELLGVPYAVYDSSPVTLQY